MQGKHFSKQQFLDDFSRLVVELYQAGDFASHDQAWLMKRSFVMGFAAAGQSLKLVDGDDIQKAIDAGHLNVFQETRESRSERLSISEEDDGEIDWGKFDSPTFERITKGS
ncbi:hypothetical protein N9M28_05465 [Luminiphilus sp.]|nr:hypothetical protein [Luminiphilus sp.]